MRGFVKKSLLRKPNELPNLIAFRAFKRNFNNNSVLK